MLQLHLKMSSAEVVCCKLFSTLLPILSIEANSMDPDQTAPIGAVWSGSKLFAKRASKTIQQMTKQTTYVVIVVFVC